jgi:putative ABC transport system permease protein
MIRHLFKLIWNRKRSNFLLMSEIFFCFLVLFAVLSLAFFNIRNYSKPIGFEHENVWLLSLRPNTDSTAQNVVIQEQLLRRVRAFPEVEKASFSGTNTPFSFNSSNTQLSTEKVKNVYANIYEVQDDFSAVMKLKMQQGRWFGNQDNGSANPPIVINNKLKQQLFGEEEAVGKEISLDDTTRYKVVGVVQYFRAGSEYEADEPSYFSRIDLQKNHDRRYGSLLLRVKPGTGVAFEEKMVKELSGIAKDWTIEATTLEKMRNNKAKFTLVPIVALGLICAFLILNVALGLFGVLWYNINRRTSEIGLRRALGAPSGQIYRQFIGEVGVLTTFGLLLGVLFAIQFPLLQVFQVESEVYFLALGCAVLLIYLVTTLCALYPSRQAARIQPAVALHEE